jgi:putative ABC transport system substrate-binding protein
VIKCVWTILFASVLTGAQLAAADESRKLPTIGLAIPVDPATDAPFQKAFRDGLRDLGYVDGKNVTLIVRYSNGDPAKLRGLIQELIALRVDVLWGDAPALKEATTTIPIVSAMMGDPVRTGLVASLARPGGNLTGLSTQRYDTDPKLLELTKELLPNLKRLCLLLDDTRERDLINYADNEFRALARDVGVSVRLIPVRTPGDIRSALRTVHQERPQALMIWASAFMYQHRHTLIGSAAHRLPVVGEGRALAEAGAVLTYSPDFADVFRRSAAYVDKILKGAKPADLPIEQPTKFKLVVNLKAAKALNINVPESILVRADEIIR